MSRRAVTLRFDLADVRRLVKHSQEAAAQREYFGTKIGPSLMLVKDEGIYLMSNGTPRDMINPESEDDAPGNRSFVAYAKGYAPGPDTWEKCRDAVGGDDFAEPLALSRWADALGHPTAAAFALRLTAKSVNVIIERQRPTAKAVK